MRAYGEIRATVVTSADGLLRIEVFADEWMLGLWEQGYADVWSFALSDKNVVREAVDAQLERLGRSR